jgi:hypothetical protein
MSADCIIARQARKWRPHFRLVALSNASSSLCDVWWQKEVPARSHKALFRRVRKTAKRDNAVAFRTAHSMSADFAYVKACQTYIKVSHCPHACNCSFITSMTPPPPTYAISKKVKKLQKLNARSTFPCGNESAMRRTRRKNTVGRQHTRPGYYAATDRVPMCWILDLYWLSYVHV